MDKLATPASESEVQDLVRQARAEGAPVEIIGGGTRRALGRQVQAACTLSLAKHSGVTLYEPGALTIIAKAGTPLAEVEQTLAAEGQRLPFEPMDHRGLLASEGDPTIGAVVACNNSGSRRIQAGACRDSAIGVRFVDGNGEAIKSGGRVMKNVTGYDLVKLMCGAYGTLGIVTEVAFKVLPVSAREATLAIRGLPDEAAIGALSVALCSPFETTGAAHLPNEPGGPLTLLRVEGLETQVSYRLERLRALCATADGAEAGLVEGEEHEALWRRVRDAEPFHGRAGAVWRISVKASDGPLVAGRIREATGGDVFYDWGGGLIWALVPEGQDANAPAVRAAFAGLGGHATLIRASAPVRNAVAVFEAQTDRLAKISRGLRQKFDPAGILNPGRMEA